MTFVVEVRGVKSDNRHRHPARLRITAYVIADFELFSHLAESSFFPKRFLYYGPIVVSLVSRTVSSNSGHGRTAETGPHIEVGDRLEMMIEAVAVLQPGFDH